VLVASLLAGGCAGLGPTAESGRQEIIDRIVASSVKVSIEQKGRRVASGSGVVIASVPAEPGQDPRTFVLTAAHVLEGWEGALLFVRCPAAQGGSGKYPATLKYRAPSGSPDLVLLEVRGITLPVARYLPDEEVRLGEEILIVGYPWGKRLALFSGIVSQVPMGVAEDGPAGEGPDQTLVVDASSSKGVSGGGVFRAASGTLVGIVEGYQTASIAVKDRSQTYSVKIPMPGETFVVPLVRIREFLAGADLRLASETPEGAQSTQSR
jgi:S1-C subfamily serine protease